jgi:alkylated DNA repair protein alkB family protein 6
MSAIDFEKMRREMREEAKAKRAAAKMGTAAEPEPEAEQRPSPASRASAQTARVPDSPLTKSFPALRIESDGWVHDQQSPWGQYEVGGAVGLPPAGAMYIPDFVTAGEEARLLELLYCPAAIGRWGGGTGSGLEKQRRTQNWGGRPGSLEVGEGLPPFAAALIKALVRAGVYESANAPNHVLVNEYGKSAGLVAHTDGPLYYDRVACLSLGGPASMKLWRQFEDAEAAEDGREGPGHAAQIFLRPRSLNVLSGEVYTNFLHSIDATPTDTITARCVNGAACGVQVGQAVEREDRRLSLVFVHKLRED